MFCIAIGPAPHRVSWALRAWNPGRVRKESGKSTPEQGPKSAERVRPGVSKESEKSPKVRLRLFSDFFETLGAHSFGTFGALPRGTLSGLFSDSSGVPGPKGPGDPVWGGANCNAKLWKCAGEKFVGSSTGLWNFRGRFGALFKFIISLFLSLFVSELKTFQVNSFCRGAAALRSPRQKVCCLRVSRDIPNLWAPASSRTRPPPHRKMSSPLFGQLDSWAWLRILWKSPLLKPPCPYSWSRGIATMVSLCWVRTASGPFLENNFHPLKLGKKWGFREHPDMGFKWVQKWVLTHFDPLLHEKTHFWPTFGPISAPTDKNPS